MFNISIYINTIVESNSLAMTVLTISYSTSVTLFRQCIHNLMCIYLNLLFSIVQEIDVIYRRQIKTKHCLTKEQFIIYID